MAQTSQAKRKPVPKYVLEESGPFSQSLVWEKIRIYYESRGPSAFLQHTVPNYVTTNAFIARSYSRVIFGFLKDAVAARQVDPDQPVYVLELGAGSGRLGYRTFLELRNLCSTAGLDLNLKLILTDLGESNRRFWLQHFRLIPLIEQGIVDIARFDVAADSELHLEASGRHVSPGSFRNPVVVLANYLFDSLPCDLFWVDAQGQIFESLTSVHSAVKTPDWAHSDVWSNIALQVHRRTVELQSYPDPLWNEIVQQCAAPIREGVVVFPVGAIRCLENLSKLCGDRFFLMASDKGYHNPEFAPTREMHFSVDGSLSLDVNFRALQLWMQSQGGQTFFPPYDTKTLDTCAMARLPAIPLTGTALAFEDAVTAFCPYDFLSVVTSIKPGNPLSLSEYLAFVRLSNYDALVAGRHADQLLEEAPNVNAEQRHQLLLAIDRVWAGYFPLGEREDIPLALGKMMVALAYWEPATELLIASVGIYGETSENTYYLALCCLQLGDIDRAADMAAIAAKLDPADPRFQELADAIAERKQNQTG